jgi:hypothetical protein
MTDGLPDRPHPGATPPHDARGLEASQRWALLLAATLLSVACCTITVAALAFAAGGSLPTSAPVLAFALTGAWLWRWTRLGAPERRAVTTTVVLLAAALVVAAGAVVGAVLLDSTFDGRWFHREAIIQLAEGWNPLYAELGPDEVAHDGARERINGYPKAPWLVAAALLALGGSIECASAFSFALLVAAAATVYAATAGLGHLGRGRAAAVAIVAAINPVAVFQLANPLIDGQLGSILLIVVASGILVHRTGSSLALAVLLMSVVYGVNVKQSALPFVALTLGGLLLSATAITRRWPRRRVLGALGLALVLGVAAIGVHPHVTNLIRYRNWAYPYETRNVTGSLPSAIRHTRIGRVRAFFVSALSRSRHTKTLWSSRQLLSSAELLKVPFDVSSAELAQFRYQGVRIGGWGPLYSGMLLAAVLAAAALLRWHPDRAVRAGLLVAVVALSVLAFPFPWVARLVPHAWLLPLVPAAAALTSSRRAVAALGWSVLVIAAVNVGLVTWVQTRNAASYSASLRERYALLACASPIAIDLGIFRAERLRLADHGVAFTEVQDAGRWLGLVLGWAMPEVQSAEPLQVNRNPALRLEWREVHGAESYQVQVIERSRAEHDGDPLTVFSRRVRQATAVVPGPRGRFSVVITACNQLGCGPSVTHGPLEGLQQPRRRPFLGNPAPGEACTTPVRLAWLPAFGTSVHRVAVDNVATGKRVVDHPTRDRTFTADLAPHGRWRARIIAEGTRGRTVSRTVEFRTTTPPAPVPLHPLPGSVVAAGPVTLRWSEVDGASAYEYLVTEPGRRRSAARGVVDGLTARVTLAAGGRPTLYHVIVRACPQGLKCPGDRDHGWGQWSTDAGTGLTSFTVVPVEG